VTIAVTTPTGHVGSHVARLLCQAGVRPRLLRSWLAVADQGWTGPLGPRSRRSDCMMANVVVVV
jgi:hypothetical protein